MLNVTPLVGVDFLLGSVPINAHAVDSHNTVDFDSIDDQAVDSHNAVDFVSIDGQAGADDRVYITDGIGLVGLDSVLVGMTLKPGSAAAVGCSSTPCAEASWRNWGAKRGSARRGMAVESRCRSRARAVVDGRWANSRWTCAGLDVRWPTCAGSLA